MTMPGKVFVVDDEPQARDLMARMLRMWGHEVETFASGEEFLKRMPFEGLGCVVLDRVMEPMDGLAVYAELRKLDETMPVVFLSGHEDIRPAVQAMKDGAVDFVVKRRAYEDLHGALCKALARREESLKLIEERNAALARIKTLSEREQQALPYLMSGMTSKAGTLPAMERCDGAWKRRTESREPAPAPLSGSAPLTAKSVGTPFARRNTALRRGG